MANAREDRLFELLNQIINILAIQVAPDSSITDRARLLKLAGLDNRRIASVLNTTVSTVSVMTTRLRSKPSSSTVTHKVSRS